MPNAKCQMPNEDRREKGFSIIELLVVIFVFSILGVVTTQIVALSLRSSNKSENVSTVKENVDYAVSTMERLLRNSTGLDCNASCGAPSCTSNTQLVYDDAYSTSSPKPNFVFDSANHYISSRSARLTSSDVEITAVSFQCMSGGGIPDGVVIDIAAQSAKASGAEGSNYTTHTRINLRNY